LASDSPFTSVEPSRPEKSIISNLTLTVFLPNGEKLSGILDTGSDIMLISEATYQQYFLSHSLHNSSMTLWSANKSPLHVLGEIDTKFKV
jgi:hypothetical protein